jgi:hypothetical protein
MMQLGPFSSLDNVHPTGAQAFQVQEGRRMALVGAANMDLDDDGWLTTRAGLVQRRALMQAGLPLPTPGVESRMEDHSIDPSD